MAWQRCDHRRLRSRTSDKSCLRGRMTSRRNRNRLHVPEECTPTEDTGRSAGVAVQHLDGIAVKERFKIRHCLDFFTSKRICLWPPNDVSNEAEWENRFSLASSCDFSCLVGPQRSGCHGTNLQPAGSGSVTRLPPNGSRTSGELAGVRHRCVDQRPGGSVVKRGGVVLCFLLLLSANGGRAVFPASSLPGCWVLPRCLWAAAVLYQPAASLTSYWIFPQRPLCPQG